jgi:hypothetical protein
MLDADNRRQAFAGVIAGEVGVGIFEQAAFAGIVVDDARVTAERRPVRCVPPSMC